VPRIAERSSEACPRLLAVTAPFDDTGTRPQVKTRVL
jgi:hypothetical protein